MNTPQPSRDNYLRSYVDPDIEWMAQTVEHYIALLHACKHVLSDTDRVIATIGLYGDAAEELAQLIHHAASVVAAPLLACAGGWQGLPSHVPDEMQPSSTDQGNMLIGWEIDDNEEEEEEEELWYEEPIKRRKESVDTLKWPIESYAIQHSQLINAFKEAERQIITKEKNKSFPPGMLLGAILTKTYQRLTDQVITFQQFVDLFTTIAQDHAFQTSLDWPYERDQMVGDLTKKIEGMHPNYDFTLLLQLTE